MTDKAVTSGTNHVDAKAGPGANLARQDADQETHGALVVSQLDRFKMAFEPGSFDEMKAACELLAGAGIKGCENPAQVMAKVFTGRALGLSFMASIRLIDNIEGNLAMRAMGKLAVCLRSPVCEYFKWIETDHEHATAETKRVGQDPVRHTYRIADAERAGLVGRGDTEKGQKLNNWNRIPQRMLRARCSGDLLDMVYPDVTNGLDDVEGVQDQRGYDLEGTVVSSPSKAMANAPTRDWEAEVGALIAEIGTITPTTTPAERRAIRDKVTALGTEAPTTAQARLRQAWDATPKAAKQGAQTPAQAPQQAAQPKPDEKKPEEKPPTPAAVVGERATDLFGGQSSGPRQREPGED